MHPSPVARLFDEQPHHPEADRSPTLAARYYVDPDVFEAEKEAIFYRSWQFAAHRSQLDAPGKFVTTRIHDQEIFLICNAHGEVRAFYNACAHRAHPLVEGPRLPSGRATAARGSGRLPPGAFRGRGAALRATAGETDACVAASPTFPYRPSAAT